MMSNDKGRLGWLMRNLIRLQLPGKQVAESVHWQHTRTGRTKQGGDMEKQGQQATQD